MTRSDSTTAVPASSAWRDPALPVAERVERLLRVMTIEEKVAQLGSRWVGGALGHPEDEQAVPGTDDAVDAAVETEGAAPNVAPMSPTRPRSTCVRRPSTSGRASIWTTFAPFG